MFQTMRHGLQCQGFSLGEGVLLGVSVHHDPGYIRDFGNPAAVVFALKLDLFTACRIPFVLVVHVLDSYQSKFEDEDENDQIPSSRFPAERPLRGA
jgi:hypothetical protein